MKRKIEKLCIRCGMPIKNASPASKYCSEQCRYNDKTYRDRSGGAYAWLDAVNEVIRENGGMYYPRKEKDYGRKKIY